MNRIDSAADAGKNRFEDEDEDERRGAG